MKYSNPVSILSTTVLIAFSAMLTPLPAQSAPATNYDESKVGSLPIPDVLTATDGTKITDKETWLAKRRPELLRSFANEVYGKTPQAPVTMRVWETAPDKSVFGGKGVMRQTTLEFSATAAATTMADDTTTGGAKAGATTAARVQASLLLFLPAAAQNKPVPVFVILNFWGNHSVINTPDIALSDAWFRNSDALGYINHRATESSRGCKANRYPIEAILERGYGLATAYYGDFDPDVDDDFQNGVHPLFYRDGRQEKQRPADDEWGAIGAWAWGLSRMADHLVSLPQVDAHKLIVLGHSRLGKTALWAGAQDERFAIVISNNSGEGGAALARRNYGETIRDLNRSFPHWFCKNYRRYSGNEGALPADQHALIALMAPRPVYIASAVEDRWADPKGEFLSGKLAEPVYALFGKPGLGASVDSLPAPETPVGDFIGYHLRNGIHDLTPYDWNRFMDFADRRLRPVSPDSPGQKP